MWWTSPGLLFFLLSEKFLLGPPNLWDKNTTVNRAIYPHYSHFFYFGSRKFVWLSVSHAMEEAGVGTGTRALEHPSYHTQAFRHSGTQALRHSSTQALRHSGTRAFRHSGIQAFRHSGIQALSIPHLGTQALRH